MKSKWGALKEQMYYKEQISGLDNLSVGARVVLLPVQRGKIAKYNE